MATDYRLDLLSPIQVGLQLGQQRLARQDRLAQQERQIRQEALLLEANKQEALRRAAIDEKTLQLRQDELLLRKTQNDAENALRIKELEQRNWINLLNSVQAPRDPIQSFTYRTPEGTSITRNVPQSEFNAAVSQIPTSAPRGELIDVDVVVSRDSEGRPKERVRRKMTKAEYDAYVKSQQAPAQTTNAAPTNIIGTWNPKSGFIRTTK